MHLADIVNLFVISFTGIIAGAYGSLIGGSGLITIPVLIFLGLTPQYAVGTNFFGLTGLNIGGWYKFHKKNMINYKIGFIVGIHTLVGTILGTILVLEINEVLLKKLIAILTILSLAFINFKPNIGTEKTKYNVKKHEYFIGAILSIIIGIYNGFYGAVAGTFLAYVLILLFRQTFLQSAGTRRIAFTFSSVVGTIIFAFNGVIIYWVGIVLFLSSFTGAYLGAHYSDRIGNVWIKRMFFIIVLIMALKLIV